MNNQFSFALPSGFDYDINSLTKKVKTKAFAKKYKKHLANTASCLTTEGCDYDRVISIMIGSAYGVNIGNKVRANLTNADLIKIKENILDAAYA